MQDKTNVKAQIKALIAANGLTDVLHLVDAEHVAAGIIAESDHEAVESFLTGDVSKINWSYRLCASLPDNAEGYIYQQAVKCGMSRVKAVAARS